MQNSISIITKSDPLCDFSGLIRSIWLMTSDFLISDEDAEKRAEHWVRLLGEDFFEKHGKYTPYLLKQCCRERSFRGSIHVDEFYRMFCRVVLEKQVYSFRRREWISETEAMEAILAVRNDLADEYRLADEASDQFKVDEILDKCRAIIYGWEDES